MEGVDFLLKLLEEFAKVIVEPVVQTGELSATAWVVSKESLETEVQSAQEP